ncbi:MAG: pirin family protein [Polyangiaceae bacterium]
MTHLRRSSERGRADFGWLDSHHTFSFGNYFNSRFRGFSDLLVINDDRVTGGAGFPRHPHRDMEIISYVVSGELSHKDTLGNGSTIRPGDVQLMGAGRGIAHSEYNSGDSQLRFLQIWIQPVHAGTEPRYAERHFDFDPQKPVQLVVSPDGADDSLRIDQDARIYRARFGEAKDHTHNVPEGRYAWLQVVNGSVTLTAGDTNLSLSEGDGVAFDHAGQVEVRATAGAEYLWFDLRGKGPNPWQS